MTKGEGYLPRIKRNIRDLRTNFASYTMNLLMKEIAHSNLTRELITKIEKHNNYVTNDVPNFQSTKKMAEAAIDYMPKKSNLNGQSSASPSSRTNNQIFGHKSIFTDCDGFNVHVFKEKNDCAIMSLDHDQLAVPVTCHKSTGDVYIAIMGESKNSCCFTKYMSGI